MSHDSRHAPRPALDPSDPVDPAARLVYEGSGVAEVGADETPLAVLRRWYREAVGDDRVVEPGAMVVATVDDRGRPNARTVLLKGLDGAGFTFFGGRSSAKGRELAATPVASLVLLWHPAHRQVRARGLVEEVEREVARTYFQSRPRDSQVAAWASAQSSPLGDRADLVAAVEAVERRFAGVDPLPLPDAWGGYRVRPFEVELWAGQRSRLHDRLVWTSRNGEPARLDDLAAWKSGRRQP